MAITHVQGGSAGLGGVGASSLSVTISAVGNGNAIVGGMEYYFGGSTTDSLTSITDDKGNTYTVLDKIAAPAGNAWNVTFVLGNITNAPTVITANFSASATFTTIILDEYSGAAAVANPTDGHVGNTQTGAPTTTDGLTSTSVTTTKNGDLIWGFTVVDDVNPAVATVSAGTGFTSRTTDNTSDNPPMWTEDKTQSSAGSVAATFTTNTTGEYFTFLVALKLPAAASSWGGTSSFWETFTRKTANNKSFDFAQGPFAGVSPALNIPYRTAPLWEPVRLKQPIIHGTDNAPGTSPPLNSPYVQAPLWEPTRLKQPIINIPDNVPAITAAIPIRENFFEPVKLKQPIINIPDKFQGTSPALNSPFVQAPHWEAVRLKSPIINVADLPPAMAQVIVSQSQFAFFEPIRLKQPIINTPDLLLPITAAIPIRDPWFDVVKLKPVIERLQEAFGVPFPPGKSLTAWFDAVAKLQQRGDFLSPVVPPPQVSTIQNALTEWFAQTKLKQPIIDPGLVVYFPAQQVVTVVEHHDKPFLASVGTLMHIN